MARPTRRLYANWNHPIHYSGRGRLPSDDETDLCLFHERQIGDDKLEDDYILQIDLVTKIPRITPRRQLRYAKLCHICTPRVHFNIPLTTPTFTNLAVTTTTSGHQLACTSSIVDSLGSPSLSCASEVNSAENAWRALCAALLRMLSSNTFCPSPRASRDNSACSCRRPQAVRTCPSASPHITLKRSTLVRMPNTYGVSLSHVGRVATIAHPRVLLGVVDFGAVLSHACSQRVMPTLHTVPSISIGAIDHVVPRPDRPDRSHYCNTIEAPWLVNGGHGASLRRTFFDRRELRLR
eukprot:COSAG01_NODE_96_length_26789_cov_36.697089_23_plen_294_part_00